MSAAGFMPDEWNRPAGLMPPRPDLQPMREDEQDAIRDTIREAMYDDKALLPDLFWMVAVPTLEVLARTGMDTGPAATRALRLMAQRAKDGVPMNDRGEQL